MTASAEPTEPARDSGEFLDPGLRAHRWFTWSLALLLLATVAVRFVRLDLDPPYGIVSNSGTFLTDEGWYGKSAQLHAKFGDWTSEHDLVWYSHNALFTALQAAVFSAFGVSLIVARIISVVSFVISIGAFYSICRTTQPRPIALMTCLLVSVTLHNLAYSRLALIEPTGTAASLVALMFWVRFRWRWWAVSLSMAFAGVAFFMKISFIYTVCAVSMLNGFDAVMQARAKEWRRFAVTLGLVLAWIAAINVAHGMVVEWAGRDGAIFQKWHVQGRMESVVKPAVLLNELKMFYKLVYATGAPTLTVCLAFGVLFFFIKQRFRPALPVPRATMAMVLWGVGGAAFFGLFKGQPPRYLYFVLFPLVYTTMIVARYVVGTRNWRLVSLFLLFVHSAVQFPGYYEWLKRKPGVSRTSAFDCAKDVMRRIGANRSDEPIVLMGGTASYVAFFGNNVRPIDYRVGDFIDLRLDRWKPEYLLTQVSVSGLLLDFCPNRVAGIESLATYRVMDNYYTEEDFELVRIVYR